jgi:hypothetical protein
MKKISIHSTHMTMMRMKKLRTCSQKRRISKLKELVLVLKYMVNGIRRATSSQKLYLRVKKQNKNSRRGYYKRLCLMPLMKKNLK